MKHFLKTLSLTALILTVSACSGLQKQTDDDFRPLEGLIGVWMERNYYPGGAIAVANSEGTVYENYYGGYTPDKVIPVASAGKWIASATVGAAVDKTSLDWDDCVEKWIPEYRNDPKGKITLRALMSHTSGIQPYPDSPGTDTYNNLDSAAMSILPLPLVFEPGSRFEYGGLGMQIAGRMVERATGMDFERCFHVYIADPLHMEHSGFTPVGLDSGHNPMLGGGFRTCLYDYMHFLDMIFHEGLFENQRILSSATISEMEADQVRDAMVGKGEYVELGLRLSHKGIYGLGLWREKIDECGNAFQVSSPGWAGAYPWINRKDGVYGFFITHVEGNSAARDNFSPLYSAPQISDIVSKIINHLI